MEVRGVLGDMPRELPGAADDAVLGAGNDKVKGFGHAVRKGMRAEVTRQRNECSRILGVSSASF